MIDEQDRITVRESRCIGHEKDWLPTIKAGSETRALDDDIIRRSFARAVKPARQQIAIRALGDVGVVVVIRVEGALGAGGNLDIPFRAAEDGF